MVWQYGRCMGITGTDRYFYIGGMADLATRVTCHRIRFICGTYAITDTEKVARRLTKNDGNAFCDDTSVAI